MYKCSLGDESENRQLLYKADSTMVVATLSFDGTYLYMANGGIGSVSDSRSRIDRFIQVLDTEGNSINKISADTVYFGDNKYLFAAKDIKVIYTDKAHIAEQTEWSELN